MSTTRSAVVSSPGGGFDIVERQVPEPASDEVRVAIEACGICHTDAAFLNDALPNISFPLVAGHEIAGRVDVVGRGVTTWQPGDRVAVGWFGGHCGQCVPCRKGDFITCHNLRVPGWAYPGGFADHIVVPTSALARIPDDIPATDAAPIACAGVTTYNALRRSSATAGDLVAIVGVGGLGHLAVQYAEKLGFDTVAIARGRHKEKLALELGAHHYIDSDENDVADALRDLGGAQVVLATAANSAAMSAPIDGLAPRGQLVVLGATPEDLQVNPIQLIMQGKSLVGHPSGTSRDIEETLAFTAKSGIRPMVESVPLEEVTTAYHRMLSGDARFRMVLTTST